MVIKASKKKCSKRKILKSAYKRKGHSRKSYTRADGTYVSGSYVNRTTVATTCIKDMGKPGKGPKTLPKVGEKGLFRSVGYSVHNLMKDRRKSLKKASRGGKELKVLKRLNLIANITGDKENKEILRKDVEFMKKQYSNSKEYK